MAERDEYAPPGRLYEARDFVEGFDARDPLGFVQTRDFEVYRRFVRDGKAAPVSTEIRNAQAAHDASVAAALAAYLQDRPRLVGIMGGHKVSRKDPAYRLVAELTRRLAREGFLVASGGGPGAMEAAHVGVACSNVDDRTFDRVLERLSDDPFLPSLGNVVLDDGSVDPARRKDLEEAHVWMAAAIEARELLPDEIPRSLAIPTWLYGNEPTMPFATAYAKYFQNSIREEALVRESQTGIVYARGRGGTIREIFQDVEENFYAKDAQSFTPMIFFDPDDYWRRHAEFDPTTGIVTKEALKIDEVVTRTFELARAPKKDKPGDTEACLDKVLYTVDFDEIVAVLEAQSETATRHLDQMLLAMDLPQ